MKIWLPVMVRLALAAVYIYAGAGKLMDIEAFARVVDEYRILPHPLSALVALLLPVLEVVAGAALVFNMRGSLAAITGMTVLFMGVLGYAMAAGLTIGDCGCFEPGELPEGVEDGSMLRAAFWRDAGLLLACAYLYWSGRSDSTVLPCQEIEETV
ncbi:DoxX family membrane protein [Desulfovibrio mangrovi]|uniref:MauE/DoxX family redox-associated membrane protein n=1 Tax=Desulfovibrio mangrovi TaxID=2976983 RepID=UPI002247F389|nr:MauE/DoxX family redox-associated membrane protein [Desulfovibrio mangrovi]UZP68977.1 DoxX family membrane protein [Desulfovibrio mangrovi]